LLSSRVAKTEQKGKARPAQLNPKLEIRNPKQTAMIQTANSKPEKTTANGLTGGVALPFCSVRWWQEHRKKAKPARRN